jgi:hypothetical protein
MTRMRTWIGLALTAALVACGVESKAPADSAGTSTPPATSGTSTPSLPALEGFGKARPVDDASKDPSLAATRDSLLDIARRRDSAALRRFIAPTAKVSFGDSKPGTDGHFAYWRQYQSMDRLWTTLADVLQHGGRLQGGTFFAPWTFQALPDSLDAFQFLVVRDSNVIVRAKPDAADAGFGTLSYDIVHAGGDRADSLWRSIGLRDGRTGYVEAAHIRSPVDYRIGLRKIGGRWMIDFFVAGD